MFRGGGHGTRTTGRLDGKEATVAVQAASVAVVCMVRVYGSRDSVGQDTVADDGSGADDEAAAVDTADASDACVCYANGHG